MKIIFICGSAEPGKDGVGDYTRRLCGELIRIGHTARIMALCDHHSVSYKEEKQIVDGIEVVAHRIPVLFSNEQRLIESQNTINEFRPDWISLQFVPYSFNPKGLPFWLPSFLKKLKGNFKWQIMIHELWIGMDSEASFKDQCIGWFQKKIISGIVKKTNSKVIHTQADLYQAQIAKLGYQAQILPLFSNITKNGKLTKESAANHSELKFCIFGSIHHGAPADKFITELKKLLLSQKDTRELKFVFIGNCGASVIEWEKALAAHTIDYKKTGFVSDQEISYLLSDCQYGITTTPYILSQKSGSLSAMFDHELPALCVARNWEVKGFEQKQSRNLTHYKNEETIAEFISSNFTKSQENNLEFVVLNFVNALK